jgi:hypothetical protein
MNDTDPADNDEVTGSRTEEDVGQAECPEAPPKEIGGRKGPDPTRYGDWEKDGRCIDF